MIQDHGVTIPSRMFGVIGAIEEYIPFCSVKRCFLISHIARFFYNEMEIPPHNTSFLRECPQ